MAASLAINRIQRQLKLPNAELLPENQELPPGHLRLFNNWRPNLDAGRYSIEAVQNVSTNKLWNGKPQDPEIVQNQSSDKSTPSPAKQFFDVVAPQFNLDRSLINSYYPPDGHSDEGRILPHIVFSDPHVPWLREAGRKDWMTSATSFGRNFVPWIALMVFKADDLRISPDDAKALGLTQIVAGKTSPPAGSASTTAISKPVYDPANLPTSGAFGMTVADYLNSITQRTDYGAAMGVTSKEYTDLLTSQEKTSIIFPAREQLCKVFDPGNDLSFRGIEAQKLLSHVRQLNTIGMPDAGVSGHGFYSVVVSSMTGDITTTVPTTHIVHLVSIEHLDDTMVSPFVAPAAGSPVPRIGIVSLFSWAYHCIPEAVNFEIMMRNLGLGAQPLRPPQAQLDSLKTAADGESGPTQTMAMQLYNRLCNGYTLARWRAPAGEESMVFNRGPLVPVDVPEKPSLLADKDKAAWPALSMTGRDYLIFDKTSGLVDASYASAWSLGRLLAISDPPFNSALLRFRSAIWSASTSNLRMDSNNVQGWSQVLNTTVTALSSSASLADGNFSGVVNRLNPSPNVPLAAGVDDPAMATNLSAYIKTSVRDAATVPGSGLYNGFLLASASSSDWEIIHKWIYDALFLGHIPAHFLFPEPSALKSTVTTPTVRGQSRLQPEALRFFNIDHSWIDALIDGALSCANHVEPRYDNIRLKIKEIFNSVLAQDIAKSLGTRPPVPRSGFITRSAAVRATPDMKVTARRYVSTSDPLKPGQFVWTVDEDHDALLRHTLLDQDTLLSLVDCPLDEIAYIEFAQPAHQQRFAFGNQTRVVDNKIVVDPKVDVIRLFTDSTRAPPHAEQPGQPDGTGLSWSELGTIGHDIPVSDPRRLYNQDTRCIDALNICDTMGDTIKNWGQRNNTYNEKWPDDPKDQPPAFVPCSTVFGLEMNDPAYHLRLMGPKPNTTKPTSQAWIRQLWTGPKTDETIKLPPVPQLSPPQINNPGTTAPAAVVTPPLIQPQVPVRTDLPDAGAPGPPQFKAIPYLPWNNPEYELLIHPDYRSPPPRPLTKTGASPSIFSIIDAIPTKTNYLFDLIFSLRRRNSAPQQRSLRFINIEIPISTGSAAHDTEKDPSGQGHQPREPLLAAGPDAHGPVRMAANPRFVASLFQGPASRIGDWRWDGRDVLLITLTPRSGKADGTLAMTDVVHSSALAARLGDCVLADVLMPDAKLNVFRIDPKDASRKTVETVQVTGRARCPVKVTEVYEQGGTTQTSYSWCMAVKSPDGDDGFDRIAGGAKVPG